MKQTKQTRFKVVLIGLALGLIEGVTKAAFPAFPIMEMFGFQAAIIGAYLTARTLSNIHGVGEENGNGEVKQPPPEIQP